MFACKSHAERIFVWDFLPGFTAIFTYIDSVCATSVVVIFDTDDAWAVTWRSFLLCVPSFAAIIRIEAGVFGYMRPGVIASDRHDFIFVCNCHGIRATSGARQIRYRTCDPGGSLVGRMKQPSCQATRNKIKMPVQDLIGLATCGIGSFSFICAHFCSSLPMQPVVCRVKCAEIVINRVAE